MKKIYHFFLIELIFFLFYNTTLLAQTSPVPDYLCGNGCRLHPVINGTRYYGQGDAWDTISWKRLTTSKFNN
ncbi:MAG: hypothetical protein H0W62_12935 [Chitinophagales bacterium]|nr:hypothetical protein [Chitinophagales bacterium]